MWSAGEDKAETFYFLKAPGVKLFCKLPLIYYVIGKLNNFKKKLNIFTFSQIARSGQHQKVDIQAPPSDQKGCQDDDDESPSIKTEYSGEKTSKLKWN